MRIPATIDVTCTCGHVAPIEQFTERPVAGPLPVDRYQCPACSRAWRLAPGPADTARGTDIKCIPTDPLM